MIDFRRACEPHFQAGERYCFKNSKTVHAKDIAIVHAVNKTVNFLKKRLQKWVKSALNRVLTP